MRFFALFFLCVATGFSQISSILNPATYVDWTIGTNCGVRGVSEGIPTKTFGANIAQGSSAATINAALSGLSAGQYALLATGDTTVTAPIFIPSGVELRFADKNTRILGNFSGTLISFAGNTTSFGTPGDITAGYTKGSTSITISGGTTPSIGDEILIYQDDEPWVYVQTPDSVKHIAAYYRCENVVGSTVTIWPALLYGSTGFNPKYKLKSGSTITNAGLNLNGGYLVPKPDPGGNTYPVLMSGCYNCYVANGRCGPISQVGVFISGCLACTIYHYDVIGVATAGDGYGVDPDNGDQGNNAIAVYNCIFDSMYHGVISSGQQGCVFAFNYSVNEHASTSVVFQTAAFNASHNAEGMMSLWESNYGNNLTEDQIHGGAAFQTLFRNRFHGVDNFFNLAKRATVYLEQGSYTYNAVGNVLGDPLNATTWPSGGTSFYKYKWTAAQWDAASSSDNGGIWMLGYVGFGQPLQASVASTLTFYSNYDYWNASIQDTGAFTMPNSLCFASKPTFFGNLAWPAYDPSSPIVYGNTAASRIPAGYRYINGFDPPQPSAQTTAINGKALLMGKTTIK